MGSGGGLEEQNFTERNVAQRSPRLYGVYLCRGRTLQKQTVLKLFQTAVYGRFQAVRRLHDIVEGFQMVLKGPEGQIAVAGDIDQRAVGVPSPKLTAQQKTVPLRVSTSRR